MFCQNPTESGQAWLSVQRSPPRPAHWSAAAVKLVAWRLLYARRQTPLTRGPGQPESGVAWAPGDPGGPGGPACPGVPAGPVGVPISCSLPLQASRRAITAFFRWQKKTAASAAAGTASKAAAASPNPFAPHRATFASSSPPSSPDVAGNLATSDRGPSPALVASFVAEKWLG